MVGSNDVAKEPADSVSYAEWGRSRSVRNGIFLPSCITSQYALASHNGRRHVAGVSSFTPQTQSRKKGDETESIFLEQAKQEQQIDYIKPRDRHTPKYIPYLLA